MKIVAALAVLLFIYTGCSGEYADDGVEKIADMSEDDHPESVIARDMPAAALRYDIDRFVERNQPKLEVYKFSAWTSYHSNEQGTPAMLRNFLSISVRDVRVIDSTHGEVDTAWKASGIDIPGETFKLERIEGTWRVVTSAVTS